MATLTLNRARVARTISGNSPMIMTFPEAASQSFKAGEFVYLVSGKVTVCDYNSALILGMAAADASGTTDKACPVYAANDDTIFELHKADGAPGAGTATTGSATAITDVGKQFGLYRNTTLKYWWVAAGTFGGNERVVVVDLSNFDAVGDTGGRLLCIVHGRNRQLFSTS